MKKAAKFPWVYLLLAYGWTWLWAIPVILTRQDYQSSPLLLLLVFIAAFGPGLAGIILTYRKADREARSDFWQRALDFRRIRSGWIVLMLFLWPALHLIANALSTFLGSQPPASEMVREMTNQHLLIPITIFLFFLQAAVEDLGWRGYMTEEYLHTSGPVKTSFLVGVFHAFWHLPFFFIAGTDQIRIGFGPDFLVFVLLGIALSFFATLWYLGCRNSTLAAILLHTVANLCNNIFTLPAGTLKFELFTVFTVFGAIIISLVWRKRKAQYVRRVTI
jgi:hypothetical protein